MSSSPTPDAGAPRAARRWFHLDPYVIAGCVMFVCIVICCWENFVGHDEELYFLGSRRIADPGFLAADFTWARLPPTSALFDHLLAPLWSLLDAFAIANLGRLVFWGLMAWSIALLARTLRLPAWSAAVGFVLWVLWHQTLGICGTPLEGFQVKSFSYPLMFFALTFAIRGQPARAGMAAGLGTAFHIVVGGWACLALFLALLVNRKLFSLRQLGIFLLSAAPFIVPLLLGVARFHGASVSREDLARMDEIYVVFAMPHCCDVSFFTSPRLVPLAWIRAAVVFVLAPIVILAWPHRREAGTLGAFVAALILFSLAGVLAQPLKLYGLLKLYPFQLANALPALFLFMFVPAWIGMTGAVRGLARVVGAVVLVGTIWLLVDRGVGAALIEEPQFFMDNVQVGLLLGPNVEEPLWGWIRDHTPRDAVFVTPLIEEFWPYAERAQVASMRHPPLDRRLIEWKERLEALNGFQPFTHRGWEIEPELALHESQLSIPDLIRIRERYGATHYVTRAARADLAGVLLRAESRYWVYDITHLTPG